MDFETHISQPSISLASRFRNAIFLSEKGPMKNIRPGAYFRNFMVNCVQQILLQKVDLSELCSEVSI